MSSVQLVRNTHYTTPLLNSLPNHNHTTYFLMGITMKRILILLTAGIVAITGCVQEKKTTEPVTRVVTVPAFAKSAVDAVGGERAWSDTQAIIGECTAKFYKPDGSFYLTRQRHAVYPWSDSIRIYAAEPQGTFVWQLSGSDFTLLEGTPQQAAELPMTLCDPSIASAIWSVMAAPASLATKAEPAVVPDTAVRVMGLWHNPLKLADGRMWYQDVESGLFDIYTIDLRATRHEPRAATITARGYDYRIVKKTDVITPTKIEIFSSDAAMPEPRRIIELDYHTLESVGF